MSAPATAPARPVLEHLNSAAPTSSTAADVPSVFETLASDELRDLIQPAFRYVLAFFAQRYPRYLLRLINSHEEVYAVFLAGIEGFHLHTYNSTFTDHFYGLQFKSLKPNTPQPNSPSPKLAQRPTYTLSRRQKVQALAYIVGIPYLRSKAQDLYERLGGGIDIDPDEPTDNSYRITPRTRITHHLSRVFRTLYPWINLGYELLTVGYDLGFAFGKGWGWRWWMRSIGIEVVRSSPRSLIPSTSPSKSRLLRWAQQILSGFRQLNPLSTTLLILKFLQWWYSPSSPRLHAQKASEERERVRVGPPVMVPPAKRGRSAVNLERVDVEEKPAEQNGENEDDDSSSSSSSSDDESTTPGTPPTPPSSTTLPYGTCLICTQPWQNPTITPTGYMGCFLCLYRAVERDGVCPVTGLVTRVDELRKVAV